MSFKEQIDNRRIKTLAQDIAGGPSPVTQLWDTYKDSLTSILADDYWDVGQRPIHNNEVISARFHDPITDGIGGILDLLVGYACIIPGYGYKSKLLQLNSNFFTLDVPNVGELTTAKSFEVSVCKSGKVTALYAFVDGKSFSHGAVVKLMSADGTAAKATLTIPANAKHGEYQSASSGFETSAASKFTITVSATSGETTKSGLHIVGLFE